MQKYVFTGNLQNFQVFFCSKKCFFIGFIYKILLFSALVDSCNGIGFPLFAFSYF